MKTAAEYIESPTQCPRCASDNVTWDNLEAETGRAWQNGYCEACGLRYASLYRLAGYGYGDNDSSENEAMIKAGGSS